MKKIIIFLLLFSLENVAQATTDNLVSCRSQVKKRNFDKSKGYLRGRKGYVVDHICPLKWGGIDDPSNMQYQTVLEGKKKDKIEATEEGKKMFCNEKNSTPERLVYNCEKNETPLEAKTRVENRVESD